MASTEPEAAMLSVVILTKNEERDLPACLDSVRWSDDVVVFDSFSTDATLEIAREYRARVFQREFDNYAAQRNASLREPKFQHPWVLILDADERVPDALRSELLRFVAKSEPGVVAARLRRRDFLNGRWLKRSQLSPYFIRVVRPENVHYEREVNEVLKVSGGIHDCGEPFDHFPFSKGLSHWFAKHNVYSTMEAQQVVRSRRDQAPFSLTKALFARDFNERRVHQKALFYQLPGRPLIKFLLIYLVRGGFLDGAAGLQYALLQSIYEYFIVLKTRELQISTTRADHLILVSPSPGADGQSRPDSAPSTPPIA